MTIDEAIKHAREVAKKKYTEGMLCHANPNDDLLGGCIQCAEEHEQIAEWLELLKWYQQGMEDIPTESGVLPKDVYKAGYNKAIDDFVKELKDSLINNYRHLLTIDTDDFEWLTTDSVYTHIDKIAQQLKDGGTEG